MGCYPTGIKEFAERRGQSPDATRRWRTLVAALSLFLSPTVFAGLAHAVVVGPVNNTSVNPADYTPAVGFPDWIEGDPGWNNVTTYNTQLMSGTTNYVYLGDNWVLSARHVGVFAATFSTGTFTPVEHVIVRNPPPSLAGGSSLTTETDLRLIRLNGDPGLPSLTIASASPPTSGNSGSEVMFIGQGRARAASETHWQVNTSNPNNWVWTVVTSGGNFHGYKTIANTRAKRWGTNRLADPSGSEFDEDTFAAILSDTTAVLPLETADHITRDVISLVTRFDQGSNGATPFEAQAVSEDSGGAVFHNRGTAEDPDWVLAGIVNATLIYGNQPRADAVYGNGTTFADLSYYNQPYLGSICDVMKTCGSYSIMGDVNVDGVVTGDGTGVASSDDVAAFVAGWKTDNGTGQGDYVSWTKGDLNLDGTTNVADFLLLRGALNGPIGSGAMGALFGGVPEPSSAILAMFTAAFLAFGRRRRAGR